MSVSLLVARLLLAGIFAVAGAATLVDRDGFRQTFSEFGVPVPFVTPLPVLLALAELSVAVALLSPATARWGALGALALLGLFATGVSVALARRCKPECHCFGQLHSAPVGWKTLARNSVLATLPGFVVWQGWDGDVGPSAIAWLGTLSISQLSGLLGGVVVLGLVGAQWWFLLHLMRQNGRLLVRVETLEERPTSGVAPPRSSPSLCCSSFGAWRANARSCGMPSGSSVSCSLG